MMKQFFNFALLGAIALSGTFGLTACSSNDEAEVTNPNFNPETNEVITKFVFNVSTGNDATTRQTSPATQATASETFRGIDEAVLFTYKQTGADGKHIATASTADKRLNLSRIIAAGTIDESKSTRVIETSLPLNTNTLLFYGRAIKGTASQSEAEAGMTAYDLFGHLEDYSVAGTDELDVSQSSFELSSRITGNKDNFEKIEALFAGVLTVIMNSNLMGEHHIAVTYGGENVEYPTDLTWSKYYNADKKSPVTSTQTLAELETKLANAYKEMTTIQGDELRAGCGEAILETIEDLWSVINEVRCAEPFCKEEAVAKVLAAKIHDRIKKYFNGTVADDGSQVTGVSFLMADNMITAFLADDAWPSTADTKPATSYFEAIKSLQGSDLKNFPQTLYHVPVGATHYLFDNTKKQFYYAVNFNSSAVG